MIPFVNIILYLFGALGVMACLTVFLYRRDWINFVNYVEEQRELWQKRYDEASKEIAALSRRKAETENK